MSGAGRVPVIVTVKVFAVVIALQSKVLDEAVNVMGEAGPEGL